MRAFSTDFRAFRRNMDSPFPSFRLIEKQGRGGAGKNRFQGTGIRRRERNGDRLSSVLVPGGATSPTLSFRQGRSFYLCVSAFMKLASCPSRCFPGETVVSHFGDALCRLNQPHTKAVRPEQICLFFFRDRRVSSSCCHGCLRFQGVLLKNADAPAPKL